MEVNIKNNIYNKFIKQINAICKPLTKELEIDYFLYTSINLRSHQRIVLTNKLNWVNSFYEDGYCKHRIIRQMEFYRFFRYCIWEDYKDSTLFIELKSLGILSGVSVIHEANEFVNLFHFGSTQAKPQQFYINNYNCFEHFIAYFLDKSSELMKTSKNHPVYINNSINNSKLKINTRNNNFFKKTKIKRLRLNLDGLYLTPKEALCVYLILHGQSAKSAANILNISPRTVEHHIRKVKQRLMCNSVISLSNKIYNSCYAGTFLLKSSKDT